MDVYPGTPGFIALMFGNKVSNCSANVEPVVTDMSNVLELTGPEKSERFEGVVDSPARWSTFPGPVSFGYDRSAIVDLLRMQPFVELPMPHRPIIALLCCLSAGVPGLGTTQSLAEQAVGDKQLASLLEFLHGDWGNMDQFFFQGRVGVPPAERRPLAHALIRRARIPGEETPGSYVRFSERDVPSAAPSEFLLIHSTSPDTGELASLVRRVRPAPNQAPFDPVPLQEVDVSREQWLVDDAQCQIRWRLAGTHFAGTQSGSGCPDWGNRASSAGAERRLTLSRTDLWIASEARGSSNRQNPYVAELRLRRANWFTCRINDVLPDGKRVPFGQLQVREFNTWTNLKVHDQGGEAWVTTKDNPPRKIGVRLHNVVWPFGESGAARGLYLLEAAQPDDGRGVAYASSSPDSRRLALSNRDVSVSCFMD